MQFDLGPLGQQTATSASLLAVGAWSIVWILFNVFRVLISTLLLPGQSLRSFGPPGTYAVITGASDGIGKEYALQLAAQGYNLVLVSRTKSKLSALKTAIQATSPKVKVETYDMDFAENKDSDYKSLTKIISKLDAPISILINNVGLSHSMPVPFVETSPEEMNGIITVNCTATLKITQLVLPYMLPQKKGLVMTMGSFGGLIPTPLLATYSGSKAFLQQWSNALAAEVEPAGITVHFVHSYLVTSAMSKIRRSDWKVPSEKTFVKCALAKVGRRGGSIWYPYSGTPYWSHALVFAGIIGILGPMNRALLDYNRSLQVSVRKRALKKLERQKAEAKKMG